MAHKTEAIDSISFISAYLFSLPTPNTTIHHQLLGLLQQPPYLSPCLHFHFYKCILLKKSFQKRKSNYFTLAKPMYGGGDGSPLQYSCLENPMDGGAWWAAVHGVAKSRTRLSDFTFTFHFHALEKEMATHSSALAWRIPGTGEPSGLLSMGSHRVGHD